MLDVGQADVHFDKQAGRWILSLTTQPHQKPENDDGDESGSGYMDPTQSDAWYPPSYGMNRKKTCSDVDEQDDGSWWGFNDLYPSPNSMKRDDCEPPPVVCYAVSADDDATGIYMLFQFDDQTGNSDNQIWDFQKSSIWPGAYLLTYNVYAPPDENSYSNSGSGYSYAAAANATAPPATISVESIAISNLNLTATDNATATATSTPVYQPPVTYSPPTDNKPKRAGQLPRPTRLGVLICAVDRTRLLQWDSAPEFICVWVRDVQIHGCVPPDIEGFLMPAPYTPAPILCPDRMNNSAILLEFKFRINFKKHDFLLTGPISVPVPEYVKSCSQFDVCIPEPMKGAELSGIGDNLLPRAVFRVFKSTNLCYQKRPGDQWDDSTWKGGDQCKPSDDQNPPDDPTKPPDYGQSQRDSPNFHTQQQLSDKAG